MEEISDHAKNLTLSEDLEKPLEERVNLFYNFVKVRTCESRKHTQDGKVMKMIHRNTFSTLVVLCHHFLIAVQFKSSRGLQLILLNINAKMMYLQLTTLRNPRIRTE